jgi:2-C-methyl-D-erythritol 4-phosphate cytidylyltransferase
VQITAILVAAGPGTRLGAGKPKAFIDLAGVPLMVHSLRLLGAAEAITAVVIVVPPGEQGRAEALVSEHGPWRTPFRFVAGGAERQDSVRAGLSAADPAAAWVAIHDAARPFASPPLVARVIEAARRHGAAIPALGATDTVKLVRADGSVETTLPRERIRLAQTPQVFRADLIREAHAQAMSGEQTATDDAALVERLGARVQVVDGEPANRKITTAEDLRWAEWWVASGRAPR